VRMRVSRTEGVVLEHVLTGESGKQIAWELGMATKTVEHHVHNMLLKSETRNRNELVSAIYQRRVKVIRTTILENFNIDTGEEDERRLAAALRQLHGDEAASVFTLGPEDVPVLDGMGLAGITSAARLAAFIREAGPVRIIVLPTEREKGDAESDEAGSIGPGGVGSTLRAVRPGTG
jgi:DNA-binding CsgD family transcriptional regulator